MIHYLKRFLLLGLLFFSAICLKANRHYIFAFDVAYADRGYINAISSARMVSVVKAILENNSFSKNDYLSFVSYSLNMNSPDFNQFATVAKDSSGKQIKWAQYKNVNEAISQLTPNWYDITIGHHLHNNGKVASMQSIAKQYVLKAVTSTKSVADETWLLMITDDLVNGVGNNYANEYNTVATAGNYLAFDKSRNDVFNFVGDFNKKIQFSVIPIKNVSGKKTINLGLGYRNLKMIVYAVHPTVLPSIHSVTDMPSTLPIKRVRGGYKIGINIKSLTSEFDIDSIYLNLRGKLIFMPLAHPKFINKEELSDGDSIAVTMTMKYTDGYYNGILVSPHIETYRQGMTINTQYKMQEEAKVFGLLPLEDAFWWFFPNDSTYAVLTWDIIITLIFIAVICFIAYKIFRTITLYCPKNEDISLEKK